MTHATAEQIHDHACGFRRSDHVESCAGCGRAADVVAEELDALRDVLNAEPAASKARPRIGSLALVAAALLLGALSWFLFQPHGADRTPAAPLPTQDVEIERLIGELKSRSPLRREIARLALKKYMGTGLAAMARAEVDPILIDEVGGMTGRDRVLTQKLKSTKITMVHERIVYTEVLYEIEKVVGPVHIDLSDAEFETAFIKINVPNGTLQDVVEQLCAALQVPHRMVHGSLSIGKRYILPSLGPVRIRPQGADPARHVADLSSDLPARRDAASTALKRLGFAAEPALWEALDSESLETRSRAAALLKGLYDPPYHGTLPPLGKKTAPKVTIDLQNQPFSQIVTDLLSQAGQDYCIVWDNRVSLPENSVTFRVRDVAFDGALALLLQPRGFAAVSLEDCSFVTQRGRSTVVTPPTHILWTGAAQARAIEPLLEDLASSDPARRENSGRELRKLPPQDALEGLACAAGYLEGEALVRCRRLRREIAESQNIWIKDVPSGAELQALTPAQKALLETVVAPSDQASTLDEILKKAGVRAVVHSPVEGALRLAGKGPKLSSLLKLVLRLQGRDFYLEGDAVIIDTAANVRAAVEK